jgi:predicted amidohydrolase
MNAAVIQLGVGADLDTNLDTAQRLVREAASAGADLVVLPEMLDYMGNDDGVAAIKSSIPGPISDQFAAAARDYGMWVVAGSIHEAIEGDARTYNTSVLFDRSGIEQARYRKIHLYDVQIPGQVDARESASIAPGEEIVTSDIDGHRAGMSICYDIRFPELYRALVDRGAEMIFLPAAFTMFTGKDHWEVLIRARAIESQAFVLAAGQYSRERFGRSMIVDPWGTVLATVPDGDGFAMARLDFDRLATIRRELPSLANRRLGQAQLVDI